MSQGGYVESLGVKIFEYQSITSNTYLDEMLNFEYPGDYFCVSYKNYTSNYEDLEIQQD